MTAVQKKYTLWISIFLIALLMIFAVLHMDRINLWLGQVMIVFRPVIIGLVVAYLCNPIFRFFERKLYAGVRPYGFRRALSLLCTYLVLFLIFVALILLIVPQLVSSILDFASKYETNLQKAIDSANGVIAAINQTFSTEIGLLDFESLKIALADFLNEMEWQVFLESLVNFNNILFLFEMLEKAFFVVTDIIFGLFISLYILVSKEKQHAILTRIRRAFFPTPVNARITNICNIADRSFGGFLRGKLFDSTIVGILVYILISILQIEYALLIAVVIGITDIVPVIGPFIGVIPSALIVLLSNDPIKVIPFLLCILIVQQIDGNIIAPKILGENTGVSSLCVMIAITLLGSIWGLVGMVVAVPLFATVIELTGSYLEKRLTKKGLPVETSHYYDASPEENTKKARRKHKKVAVQMPYENGNGTITPEESERIKLHTLAAKHDLLKDRDPDRFKDFSNELFSNASSENAAQGTCTTEN